jgi:hypothetical protein
MSGKSGLQTRGERASGLRVGSKGFVRVGEKKRLVRIIEDRGKIGVEGRRLLRVTFSTRDGAADHAFEIPADEVTAYPAKAKGGARYGVR